MIGIGNKRSKDDTNVSTRLLYSAEVLDISDKDDAGRILVRIQGIDDTQNSDKVTAFPLLPKTYQVFPKVGETVFIINEFLDETYNRYWIGPIISQPQKIGGDDNFTTAKSGLVEGSNFGLDVAPSSLKEAKGVYPDKVYVSQIGRNNTDIIHKDNEILIRTGKHIEGNPLVFNKKNPGFIQIKSNVILPPRTTTEPETVGSITTLVGNRINLITHDGSQTFDTTDPSEQITTKTLQKIINEAHPLVFGDSLVKFLKVQRAFELNHVHEQINLSANSEQPEYKDLMNFPLNQLLSKNIRIN